MMQIKTKPAYSVLIVRLVARKRTIRCSHSIQCCPVLIQKRCLEILLQRLLHTSGNLAFMAVFENPHAIPAADKCTDHAIACLLCLQQYFYRQKRFWYLLSCGLTLMPAICYTCTNLCRSFLALQTVHNLGNDLAILRFCCFYNVYFNLRSLKRFSNSLVSCFELLINLYAKNKGISVKNPQVLFTKL